MKKTKPGVKQYWSMTEGVYNCLIDSKRSKAFARAIKNTIRKGDVVVDMGTGSGILAMMAAKAGAKKVYAIELDKNNIKTLKHTFKENGFGESIEVIESDILKVKIPEKVDVIIGEMIATALIEELQVKAMNHVLQFAKRNVRVLLNHYLIFVDLVYNKDNFYGLTFKVLRYEYPDEVKIVSTTYSKKYQISSFDFSKVNKDLQINKTLKIKVSKSGTINGLRLSGKTIFNDNTTLGATFAYDYPLILPIKDMKVTKGDVIITDVSYIANEGLATLDYNVTKN